VAGLVLWLLGLRGLSLAALAVWPVSALLAVALIRLGTGSAGAPSARQNRNPYSAGNAQVFLGVPNGPAPAAQPPGAEPARTVVLVMWRRLVAQELAQKLQDAPGTRLVFELSYSHAQDAVRSHGANAALVEAAESGSHGVDDCLALCARLREEAPRCKLLLMCPEQRKEVVAQAVEAKRLGRVDDFVFYDSSVDYVAAKLLAM
jgi:hypothetical protein